MKLDALSCGFFLFRSYEGVDDPSHVTKDNDGVWHFKLGERVLVKIEMIKKKKKKISKNNKNKNKK